MQDDIVGTEVGGYRVEEVVGRGGMGVVYRAQDLTLSRDVALKCIDRTLSSDEAFVRRFRSEARALARIESPFIVQVHALSRLEIGLVIVMEFVEGGNLKRAIEEQRVGWPRALVLLRQTLRALEHAHEADVVHRDVKPHNILLADPASPSGARIKMTDFGLAKIHTDGNRSRTVTEGVYGSLNYMSPEQIEGLGRVDRRSDLYSLGMTAYELLAGRLPFDEEATTYRIMQTIVEEELPPLTAFVEDVPGPLVDLVMKTLEKDPDDRFQSAAEMRAAVADVSRQLDAEALGDGADGRTTSVAASGSPESDGSRPGSPSAPSATEGSGEGRWPDLSVLGGGALIAVLLVLGGLTYAGYLAPSVPEAPAPPEPEGPPRRPSAPTPIAPLVDVNRAETLRSEISEKVEAGTLIRGAGPDDFFIPPEQCYVFVLNPGGTRVTAVLDTGRVRVDLRSRSAVSDWPERYADRPQIWVAPTREGGS